MRMASLARTRTHLSQDRPTVPQKRPIGSPHKGELILHNFGVDMGYSVFISYSTRDLPTANSLREWITYAGAQAFLAEYSVEPGRPLADDIIQAIRGRDLFLLLWSHNARG